MCSELSPPAGAGRDTTSHSPPRPRKPTARQGWRQDRAHALTAPFALPPRRQQPDTSRTSGLSWGRTGHCRLPQAPTAWEDEQREPGGRIQGGHVQPQPTPSSSCRPRAHGRVCAWARGWQEAPRWGSASLCLLSASWVLPGTQHSPHSTSHRASVHKAMSGRTHLFCAGGGGGGWALAPPGLTSGPPRALALCTGSARATTLPFWGLPKEPASPKDASLTAYGHGLPAGIPQSWSRLQGPATSLSKGFTRPPRSPH